MLFYSFKQHFSFGRAFHRAPSDLQRDVRAVRDQHTPVEMQDLQQRGDQQMAPLSLPHAAAFFLSVLSRHLQPDRHTEEPHARQAQPLLETGRSFQLQLIVPTLLRRCIKPHQLHLRKMMSCHTKMCFPCSVLSVRFFDPKLCNRNNAAHVYVSVGKKAVCRLWLKPVVICAFRCFSLLEASWMWQVLAYEVKPNDLDCDVFCY